MIKILSFILFSAGQAILSNWMAFIGAALGAIVSSVVAIAIFYCSNRKEHLRQDKVRKMWIEIIEELCNDSVRSVSGLMTEINEISVHYEKYKETGERTALPYKVPYALLRLKNIDLQVLTDTLSNFEITGVPIATIDFLCHYIEEVNKEFEKHEKVQENGTHEDICKSYEDLIKWHSEIIGKLKEKRQQLEVFQRNIEAGLKKK